MTQISTEMEDYLFDLKGYIVRKAALEMAFVDELNQAIDAMIASGEVKPNHNYRIRDQRPDYPQIWIENILEAGFPFRKVINHPAWIEHVRRYNAGEDGTYIITCDGLLKGEGVILPSRLHSGGHRKRHRVLYGYFNGEFRSGELNVLLPLSEFGPGDGATMVIPGSHKSDVPHPAFSSSAAVPGASMDDVAEAVEVRMQKGDVLIFAGGIAHGTARRINPGFRRCILMRYGPAWPVYKPSKLFFEQLDSDEQSLMLPNRK